MTDLGKLLDYGLSLPPTRTTITPAVPAVCMNQDMPCGACVFHSGRLAKWCKPEEREAKAKLDSKPQGER